MSHLFRTLLQGPDSMPHICRLALVALRGLAYPGIG